MLRAMRGQGELPPPDHPLFAYTDHFGLRVDLAAAIQSLPEKCRKAIIPRDFEEFSITEIADRLLLTREAVKSRIHRGRQMVQEYLKDWQLWPWRAFKLPVNDRSNLRKIRS